MLLSSGSVPNGDSRLYGLPGTRQLLKTSGPKPMGGGTPMICDATAWYSNSFAGSPWRRAAEYVFRKWSGYFSASGCSFRVPLPAITISADMSGKPFASRRTMVRTT